MATGATDFTFGFTDTPGFREFAEVPNYAPRKVIYFSSPFSATQGYYRGLVVVDREATGGGTSSETASGLRIVPRTGSDSTSGSSTTSVLLVSKRIATGSGAGTQSATPLKKVKRTASDAAQPFRTNLIPNPSFESGTSDWLALNSATISQSSAQAWRDVYSLSVTTSTTFFSGISTDFIPATAGVRYTVSWYARSATGSVGSMRPALLVFDSSNTQLTSGISFSRTFTTTWTRFSMSLTAPANTASIKFRLDNTQNVGGLVFYVDGVLLEAADSAGTYFEGSIGANAPLGSSTAVGNVASGRTATGDATGTSTAESSFFSIVTTTATGSGVGSGLGISAFTGTGTGTGTSTATWERIIPRTATGSGTGASVTTQEFTRARIATASGEGTSSVSQLHIAPRTATSSGEGSSLVVKVITHFRTATGSGTGGRDIVSARVCQRTATAAGTGGQSNTVVKLLLFRTPATTEIRAADRNDLSISGRLFRYAEPSYAGVNVYKLVDGSFTEVEQRDYTQIAKVYHGGSKNFVTQAEKDELIAAGYGSYVT